jgi:putative endonuclease
MAEPRMKAKNALGRQGEDVAASYLADQGFTVIERNWRCEQGEIDLVGVDGRDTVFVEVKTRSSTAFGHPFEAITDAKLARLRRLAGAWCEAHNPRPGIIRLDVVSVLARPGALPLIEHLRGVFR